ncbi:class I SAM-dependent methyltransferase [bacterium]|nr:MAG: class I SAM-dependent methyltransferase [bacterium]
MQTNTEIKDWYNSFSASQVKTGVNLRHFTILKKLKKLGLKKNHAILEIGCGIGTLTGLLGAYVNKGSLLATDISDQSITIATERLKHLKQISFAVTDMENFNAGKQFDFIVLPDVMEHIPEENHGALFKTIASHMHQNSVICIHIPHPRMIDYTRTHQPEKLQVIDQAIEAPSIITNAFNAGLQLDEYNAYSLYDEYFDYVFIVLRKMKLTDSKPFSQHKIILKKLLTRLAILFS